MASSFPERARWHLTFARWFRVVGVTANDIAERVSLFGVEVGSSEPVW